MRILHVETGRHLYGGAQQVVYLLNALADRDVENVLVCTPDSAIRRVVAQRGHSVEALQCRGDVDVGFGLRLRSLVRRVRPDIVHSHSRRGADWFGARAAGDVPAVLSRRVDSTDPRWLARLRYAHYRRLVAISRTVADALRDSGVDAARVAVIRSAVDADLGTSSGKRVLWRQEFDLDEDEVVGVVAAQFIERKGHRRLLQVLPQLCREQPRFRLLMFGKGPLQDEIGDELARLGLMPQVQMFGFRDDFDQLIGCADLLIHPAVHEGLGVSMLKAAAAGLPVVAFDVAGAREAVVHNSTGLLVPSGDNAALLRALTDLIENSALRRTLGMAGQARMRDEFSIDAMADQHVQIYRMILNE